MENRIREGEAHFSAGRIWEAERCFLEILNQKPDDRVAYNNLGVVAFHKENGDEAIEYFRKALEIDPFYKEALLNIGNVLKQLNRLPEILPVLEKAGARFLEDEDIRRLLEEIAGDGKPKRKIAFLCVSGFQSFLSDIVNCLREKYEVRTCYSNDTKEIDAAVTWADLVWLEWANEMAMHVTNKVPAIAEKYVVCRIHSYEVLHGYLPKISWSKIDKIIFVAEHLRRIAHAVYPDIRLLTESAVIPNGVQLEKYPFKERKPGYNIAVVANISHKKNPSMWIEIVNRLVELNSRYTLHIAGEFQELRYQYFLEDIIRKTGIEKNVRFCGWINDIPNWLEEEKINYLLSTSIFESFGYGIAEAMAMGLRPLIYSFPGAEEVWPKGCIFHYTGELIHMIRKGSYDSGTYRQFVKDHYSLKPRLLHIEALIENVIRKKEGIRRIKTSSCKTFQPSPRDQRSPVVFSTYHKPERNVIITGIPRSGTSLFSVLLNNVHNAVCLNEVLYDVYSLPQELAEIRRRLVAGEPIPNRYDSSGALTCDTQNGKNSIEYRRVKTVDRNVVIGSKINIPYLNQIETILNYGYKVIAIVRDPVYTIGSWNSKKATRIPEAQVTDENLHPRWTHFPFVSSGKLERQAQIWQFYATLIWKLQDRIKIYTYEQITNHTDEVLSDVCRYLNLEKPDPAEKLKNLNVRSRYTGGKGVRRAVREFCPIRQMFGYGDRTIAKTAYHPKPYWERRGVNYKVNTERYNSDSEIPTLEGIIETYELYDSPLLEVGSGYGRIYQRVATICSNVTLCDFSNSMRKECERITGVLPDYWDGERLPYADGSFELVILFSVLLHVPPGNVEEFISEILRVTRQYIFIATYTGKSPHTAGHVFNHDYHKLFKKNGLRILLEKKIGDGLRTNWLLGRELATTRDREATYQELPFGKDELRTSSHSGGVAAYE